MLDEEFTDLVEEPLSQIDSDLTVEKYIDVDTETCTPEPGIYSDKFNWREALRNACIEEHLHGPIEVVEEDADNGDDDES